MHQQDQGETCTHFDYIRAIKCCFISLEGCGSQHSICTNGDDDEEEYVLLFNVDVHENLMGKQKLGHEASEARWDAEQEKRIRRLQRLSKLKPL